MDLAVVRGQCTSTVKTPSLEGRRLVAVQRVTPDLVPDGPVEVALDSTSAGNGQLVLLVRGSAARLPTENRQLATDLAVVAIVDHLGLAPLAGSAETATRTTTKRSGAKKTATKKTAAPNSRKRN